MLDFSLCRPSTVQEASAAVLNCDGSVFLKAGGTDLIVWMNKHAVHPDLIVDISAIPSLGAVSFSESTGLSIGALCSINETAKHPAVKKYYPAVYDACLSHSDQLIRNKATVVGNLCAAVPSADMVPALIVHGAVVHISGPDGEREVAAEDFSSGPRKTVLAKGDVVTHLSLPVPKSESRSCYIKLGRRNSLDLAQVGIACLKSGGPDNPVYRIACGAVAPKVVRAVRAEELLAGVNRPDEKLLNEAASLAEAEVSPISDVRASKEYRLDQVGELVKRAVALCAS